MTPIEEFKALLLTADPKASHYKSTLTTNYTVWAEFGVNTLNGDGKKAESADKIQVDRFTKVENDHVVKAITDMLDANGIAYDGPLTSYEPETGYIHCIWICEVD